jgi:hypothetical protein
MSTDEKLTSLLDRFGTANVDNLVSKYLREGTLAATKDLEQWLASDVPEIPAEDYGIFCRHMIAQAYERRG